MAVDLSKEPLTMESMRYVFGFLRTTGVVNVDQIESQLKVLIDQHKQSQDRERVLRDALTKLTDTIDDQFGIAENQLEVIYISEFGLEIDPRLEPWCSLFESNFKALKALEASK